jgi:hypothetical protein
MKMKWMYGLIFVSLSLIVLSCKSYVDKRDKAISKAWTLLDNAEKSKEIDMSVPLGFVLGCTDDEFYSHCEQLVKKYGGRKSGTDYKIKTDEFGVQDTLYIYCFPYFSDSNTEMMIALKEYHP